LCARLGIKPAVVEYTFVGLFDTVSSYEHGASFVTNVATVIDFGNDVEELHLRLTDPAIKKVVHLTAGDEYRQNFASTTIASAIAAGTGYELQLPGVHSDIGGGYGEVEEEDRLGTPEQWQQLIAQGWYRKEQVNILLGRGSRRLTYHYQLIALTIMRKLATGYGMLFTTSELPPEVNLNVPADLLQAHNELVSYAEAHDGAHRKQVVLRQPLLRQVRNRYLHRSANDGTGMQGNFEDDQPTRISIPG